MQIEVLYKPTWDYADPEAGPNNFYHWSYVTTVKSALQ
jgi:hypothetical protein